MKRLISCYASDCQKMTADELKLSIQASAGRTIVGETVVLGEPLIEGVTNQGFLFLRREYTGYFLVTTILGMPMNMLMRKYLPMKGKKVAFKGRCKQVEGRN